MARSKAISLITSGARLLRRQGVVGFAQRAARFAYLRLGADALEFPLLPGDVVSSGGFVGSASCEALPNRPLRIGWITVPPAAGSGGHTTMFRMISALESAGHSCVVYLYDRFAGNISDREEVIRSYWPQVRAEIRDARDGLSDMDALVATSWLTAHVAAAQADKVRRCFYFVQDYEPYFYPRGSEYALAEDTFRFGFYGITAGSWLSAKLESEFGMRCDPFQFGADSDIYQYDPDTERDGVVFYAKPGVARRGYRIGTEVLREFAKRYPRANIHLFGERVDQRPFPAISHGRCTPTELNRLYNTCRVGLSLSFTNVSLIPWELLAAGVVPVVNDADHNRLVLDNSCTRWAAPTVLALTDRLSEVYETYTSETGRSCAESVRLANWNDAGAAVVGAIERETRSEQRAQAGPIGDR